MTAPHVIKLSHVPSRAVATEALALYVDGFVEGERVSARDFLFDATAFGVTASLRHPASENPPHKVIAALYNVIAGFHKSGADIQIDGPLASLLPGGGRVGHSDGTRPAFAVRQIFEAQRPDAERTPPIEPEVLAEIHAALPVGADIAGRIDTPAFRAVFPTARKEPNSERTWLLTHRCGVDVAVLTADARCESHCFVARRPLSVGCLFGFPEPTAARVRTWGDAWIGHSWGGRRVAPEGLEILPSEVAIVHDVSVYRYEIADRATLDDLAVITFGKGTSPFAASVWLGMAEQCGEAGHYDLAARCCDQAVGCAEDPQTTRRASEEAAHWRDWLAWSSSAAGAPSVADASTASLITPSPVRPVAELIARVGPECRDKLAAVVRAMRGEREDAHDYRRRVGVIDQIAETGHGAARFSLAYRRLTGRDIIASGVPADVLRHLGAGASPMPPPMRFDEIFTLRAGDALIWGSVETGCLVLLGKPAVAFSIDR